MASQPPAIADCSAHGRLTRSYSIAQLHAALAQMPADLQEYTNCYNVIEQRLLATLSGSHRRAAKSDAGSSGSFLPTPVIVGLVVVVLGGTALAVLAIRRHGQSGQASS
jgi:hypothetical protein